MNLYTSKCVWIVEDDLSIAAGLEELLLDEGYEVRLSENGDVALQGLRSTDRLPDVILLDLMMPVKDAFQFRKEQELDARLASIPLILMSADVHVETKKIRIGAKRHLKKPLDIEDILQAVAEVTQ